MKINKTTLIFFFLLVCFQLKSEEVNKKNFLVLSDKGQEPIDAIPILDGVVIKFDGDNVILKKNNWETKIERSELKSFDYVNEFHSDLTVKLIASDHFLYNAEGKIVTLHNEFDVKFGEIIKETNEEGETTFQGIPAGFYTLQVSDPENIFLPVTLSGYHLGLSSIKEISVQESAVNQVVEDEMRLNNQYYDLHGRPVLIPTPGIYIFNGKKIIIK